MLEKFQTHLSAKRRSPNTIRLRLCYIRMLERACPLAEVTPTVLESIITAHSQWAPETVNAAVSSWRVFYKWATRNGHLDVDPTEDLELVYVPRVVKVLSDDMKVRAAVEGGTLAERVMLRLGRECGLRRAEIASLHTSNRTGGWIRVTGKGGRTRTLHLEPDLAADLEKLAREGFYFPGRDNGHVPPATVYRTVRRLIETGPHSLRRSAITAVFNGSHDIRLAQEFAGHADPAMTAVYIDVTTDDRVRAGRLARVAA